MLFLERIPLILSYYQPEIVCHATDAVNLRKPDGLPQRNCYFFPYGNGKVTAPLERKITTYIARCVTHRWRWLQNASQGTVINDTPFYGNCNDFHDLENRCILSIY